MLRTPKQRFSNEHLLALRRHVDLPNYGRATMLETLSLIDEVLELRAKVAK